MASNLPPGVTPGMIPGNRPDDDDAFWSDFIERCTKDGFTEPALEAWMDDDAVVRLIEIARESGYGQGLIDGRAEAEIDYAARGTEEAERDD